MVFNTTVNYISAILWRPGVPGDTHQPAASH